MCQLLLHYEVLLQPGRCKLPLGSRLLKNFQPEWESERGKELYKAKNNNVQLITYYEDNKLEIIISLAQEAQTALK